MAAIRTLFSTRRRIDRRIEKVIDYAAREDERLLAEIEEYEATDNVEACFRKFLEHYRLGVTGGQVGDNAVWVSGFYGSGKSSFTKYLGLALEGKKAGTQPFVALVGERLQSTDVQALLRTVAAQTPTAVVFLDLGAEQLADNAAETVSNVLYWKVLQFAGYSKEKKLAQLELTLEREGKYEAFRQLYQERWGEPWENVHNAPVMGTARAAQLVPELLPKEFPTPESFRQLRFELADNLRDRAKEMIELVRRKLGKQNILFMIDEAGQYVAPRQELILNLDGLVRDFKELGQGKVWVVATGQQTLAEIVSNAQYNSAELNRLQARFPVTIELDARDIKEITYRRLLTKTPEALQKLKDMFRQSGQALVTHTRLEGTTLYRADPNADTFAQFYPFLPQHFDLLLELIRTLARSTGGIGLRSAIKVIQDVLVDVNRLLPPDATRLADREVGQLACADDFFDILRNDLLKVLPHVVAAVDRVASIFGGNPLALRVAKAVAALQPIETFPASAENLAALLYPALDRPSQLPEVRELLRAMLAVPDIGLVEDPKVGGYVFLSDKAQELQRKRSGITWTSGDLLRIRNEILGKRLFEPQPSARVENSKDVRAAVRADKALVAGDNEDLTFRLEWVDAGRWDQRRQELLTETAAQPEWQAAIAWLARRDETVDELLPEIYKSEQIAGQVDERSVDRDQAQFLRAERKLAETNRDEVERRLRQTLLQGTLIFRGRPTPAGEAGLTVDAAARTVLAQAAKEVFKYYYLAPVRVATDLAANLLKAERLDRAGEYDPLKLATRQGSTTRINTQHPALAEVLRAFRAKLEETGSGRLQGNFLQDFFAGPPYGWSKDTARYLFAALLWAAEVEFHTPAGALKVPGPAAVEAAKSTLAFNKVGVSMRDAPPDLDALDRAARRLEELFGDNVMPLEDSVSRAVRRRVPEVLEEAGALPDRLRLLGLAGEPRARNLNATLTRALSGDATDAGSIFGARDATVAEDIRWAQAAMKALSEGAERDVQEAVRLRSSVQELDLLFPGEGARLLTEADRETLAEALASERFFERLPEVRGLLRRAQERAEARYTELGQEQAEALRRARLNLEAHPDWPLISDEDRTALMGQLEAAELPPVRQAGAADLRMALVRQARLAQTQREFDEEVRRRVPPPPPSDGAAPEVANLAWAEMQPPGLLTTESELDEWLKRLRARLASLLRAGKQVRLE
ncbi:MAG: BREX system P-loop protein BrxC [Anaerolineales bacterium]|nr:BREX system P-loop protein BrxC [Anaerolineales bacterium]